MIPQRGQTDELPQTIHADLGHHQKNWQSGTSGLYGLDRLGIRAVQCPRLETHKPRFLHLLDETVRGVIRDVTTGKAPWPLTLTGRAGSGKSCAALLVADYVIGVVEYYTLQKLCSDLIDADKGLIWSGGPHSVAISSREIWGNIDKAALVIIDEIGTRSIDWARDTLQRVIDSRECRPLILVSNLSPSQFDSVYDSRIQSRIDGGTVMDMSYFPDRRQDASKHNWPL